MGNPFSALIDALGLSGEPSLGHIQDMVRGVEPDKMEALAAQLDHGETWGNRGATRLDSGINTAVSGWKGQAADAASVKVAKTSSSGQETSAASSTAAAMIRNFASETRENKGQILAIKGVDTSMGAAAKDAGVLGALNPGFIGVKMAERQAKANKQRDQAAGYMDSMNSRGNSFGEGEAPFPTGAPGNNDGGALPRTLHMDSLPSSGGSGSGNGSGNGGGSGSGGGNGSGNGGGSGPGGGSGSGSGSGGVVVPSGGHGSGGNAGGGSGSGGGTGGLDPYPGVDGTNPTSGGIPAGPVTNLPAAASITPVESGGPNLGLIGGLAAGGGALAAAGGLAGGVGRGALAGGGEGRFGRSGAGEGRFGRAGGGSGDSFARGGAGGANGTGAGDGAAERGLAGRGAAAESSGLRPGMGASAMAEEAAANRGFMPGGAGAGARRGDDEDELERRPDYLVAGDDIWGDGRLAAPPVLG